MLPVLLDLKFIKVYTFGVFVVLAFFWGAYLLWRNIKLTAYKEEEIFDGLIVSILGSLFVGRLFYVLLNFKKFKFDVLKFILINGYPGFMFWGLIIGGFISLYIYTSSKKMKFHEVVDYFISPLFVAMGFIKLGSFFSGVEVGTPTTFLLSIRYANFPGLRHLTPFYESVLFFIGAYITYKFLFDIRRQKYKKSFSLYFFFFYTSLVYFVFDNFKVNRVYFLGFSFNFSVSLFFFIISGLLIFYFQKGNLIKNISGIKNLLNYGSKTINSIHKRSGKATSGGEGKESRSSK